MTYPHAHILRAWLDGSSIQYRPAGTEVWIDIDPASTATKTPHLYTDGRAEYRVKPVTVRYRVALMRRGVLVTSTLLGERSLSENAEFVRWLTDWTEVQA